MLKNHRVKIGIMSMLSGFLHRASYAIVISHLVLLSFLLSACVQVQAPPTLTPSITPVTPTSTVFFPTLIPSPTFTPQPTGSPTPDLSSGLGIVIFRDDFHVDQGWSTAELAQGGMGLSNGQLVLSVRQPNSLYLALSPVNPLSDGYIEVDVQPELCTNNDEFGLAFRVSESFEHYRLTLNCQGEARVVGVVEGSERILVPNTTTTAIYPGLFLTNRLAVWMQGDQFRFYINGEQVFADRDTALSVGRVGLIVRARQSGQTTAAFDLFEVRSLVPLPSSTPTG
jgi:hypothetical protein